ncbi:MAG: AsnC family transcriptional regulator [Nanoarchaeota archaeon]|nr:AsnC family transcriptional regulator [Nanoarchaeota archaeon]
MNLDMKERKILKELLLNSRIPITLLARKVGVSREVALYRVNKLRKDVIKGFYTMIDTRKLGFHRHACFMQLKGVSAEEEAGFIRYLAGQEHITYLGPVIGRWNVVFDILARDDEQLKQIMDGIMRELPGKVDNYVIAGTLLKEEMFPTKIVGITQHAKDARPVKSKRYELDDTDKIILGLLSDNPRLEYTEISSKLKMTANSIRYRIRNLEKSGIVQGYSISVDMKRLGLDFYNLQLKITNPARMGMLVSFLRSHPKSIYYYRYLGHENWDIDVGVVVRDSLELRDFILDLRKSFTDTVKLFDLYVVTEETKANYPSKELLRNC